MQIIKPAYFDSFCCIAGNCPDSCCTEWDVQVDPEKAAFYRALPGDLGDRLRQVLKDEDGETFITIENRRCPMLRADGLCRIHAELGEAALCKTCRDFPRLSHDYGDFIEYGLELSCPEAARIILSTPAPVFTTQAVPGGDAPEYDAEDMEILLRTRDTAREILSDSTRSAGECLISFLSFACRAHGELNGFELTLAENPDSTAQPEDSQRILDFYKTLEILTPIWAQRLAHPAPGPWESRHLTLARYFVDRYWLQAISDYDLIGRAKFTVISCLVVRALGGDLIQTAQLYSKEIENSIENVEAILDAAYEHPCFATDTLSRLLLT